MKMPQQKKTFKIPKGYSRDKREEIAFEIINYLVKRTRKGHGKGDRKWRGADANKYEDGKKGPVDLTESTEMLSRLGEYTRIYQDKIVLGYDKGSDIEGKVEGNRIGSYGQPSANKKKARDFLDHTDKEILEHIRKKFPRRAPKAKSDEQRLEETVITVETERGN